MPDKFKNKYRIESTRLRNWDYGWNAAYYVTICTKDRICFFGKVMNNEMILNDIGLIAHECWTQIPDHFPFVKLGNHIIMPDHVHGIVVIDKHDDGRSTQSAPTPSSPKNKFGPQSQNLASIIRGFKIGVTKNARLIEPGFGWQARYHDRIIRDEKSYHHISEYIANNPLNWAKGQILK